MCSPEISYAVMKGAMNNTLIKYSALTGVGNQNPNPPSLTFNIQVPSEQIVLDRRVMIKYKIKATIEKTINGGNVEQVWCCDGADSTTTSVYGGAECLNCYPFHQLVSTAQITVNNTSVSLNVQDVLPAIIRFNDDRLGNKINGSAPIQVDSDGGYGSTAYTTNDGGLLINKPNSPFASDTVPLDEAFTPRGSFVVRDVSGNQTCPATGTARTIIEFEGYEPVMVSPFTFANCQSNSQGIYGLQNLSFNFNLGSFNRLIRSRSQIAVADGNVLSNTTVVSLFFETAELQLTYLTPQPTDALASRNAVPFYELPRYPSNKFSIPATPAYTRNPTQQIVNRIPFPPIQLNQIPDKLIIFAREGTGKYNNNTNCADFMGVINDININFNNQSGLLSTMSQYQLFKMSRENGSIQSWQEFSGLSNTRIGCGYKLPQSGTVYSATPANVAVNENASANIVGTNGVLTGQAVLAPQTGSLLVLQFGKDIELPDYYAPGSLGNFNLQFDITIGSYNNIATEYQLIVIAMNTGVLITEKGQTATYTGLLTKEDVLQASAMEAISTNDYRRLVGSGFWDNLKSIGSKAWNFAKPILGTVGKFAAQQGAQALQQSGNPYASMAGNLLGKVVGNASGMSGGVEGGAMSAGAMSAGRRRVMKHLAQ